MEGENAESPTSATAANASMSVVTNQRLPLQRARYVHVTDLTSAYNVDNAKLIQELERVKNLGVSDHDKPELLADGVPAELDTSEKKRLQPPKGGSNMVVLVGQIRLVVDKKRVDGSRVRLAEVEVGDETGLVSLRARDQQIDALQVISDRGGAVVLRNCSLELYQGKHLRLAVTKWGKLTPYPDNVASTPSPPSKMNRERNYSLIDLTVVASESPGPDVSNSGESNMFNYSNDPGRVHHSGGRGHRGKKPHQRQIRHSPPMMPTMHPQYMDPSTQQYASSGAMHYDSRFALPPQHQYYSHPGQAGSSLGGGQQMIYNNMRRGTPSTMGGGYAPPQQNQQQHAMSPDVAHGMFLAHQHQQQQQHAMETDGSPDQRHAAAYGRQQDAHSMQGPSHMNPQAATFDPSLYPSYHAP